MYAAENGKAPSAKVAASIFQEITYSNKDSLPELLSLVLMREPEARSTVSLLAAVYTSKTMPLPVVDLLSFTVTVTNILERGLQRMRLSLLLKRRSLRLLSGMAAPAVSLEWSSSQISQPRD